MILTNPSLTLENVSNVMAIVKLECYELGEWILTDPKPKCEEIYQQSSTAAQEREGLIYYFLNYSEFASWRYLAGQLYYRQHYEALSAARRFIKTAPGKCMYTTVLQTQLFKWKCS